MTIPVYNLATKEDHIAPANSVFVGAKFFGGPMRYVLAGSGPYRRRGRTRRRSRNTNIGPGPRSATATKTGSPPPPRQPGSWWPDWMAWVAAQAPDKVTAREPGGGVLQPLCDAPGEYVRVKS